MVFTLVGGSDQWTCRTERLRCLEPCGREGNHLSDEPGRPQAAGWSPRWPAARLSLLCTCTPPSRAHDSEIFAPQSRATFLRVDGSLQGIFCVASVLPWNPCNRCILEPRCRRFHHPDLPLNPGALCRLHATRERAKRTLPSTHIPCIVNNGMQCNKNTNHNGAIAYPSLARAVLIVKSPCRSI